MGTYTGMYNYQLPVVAKTVVPTVAKTVVPTVAKTVVKAPVVYSALNYGLNYGLNHPAVYNTHLIKREAEAEADPAVFYNNYYNAPAYTAGLYNGYTGYTTGLNYAYNPVYGYNNYGYNYLY